MTLEDLATPLQVALTLAPEALPVTIDAYYGPETAIPAQWVP